jgi:two-component system sensor histidine kinase QseC
MRRWHLGSLRNRLLLGVMGGVMLMWLVAAWFTWRDAEHELGELLDAHLAQAAALLVAPAAHEHFHEELFARAPHLHRYATRVVFQVWHEGQLMQGSGNAPSQPLTTLRSGFDTTEIAGQRWRVFATVGDAPDIQIYVGEQLDVRDTILRAVLRSLMWPLLLGLPLLALAAWWAVRLGLAPLDRLSAKVALRQPDALDALSLRRAPTELQPLVAALNALFARVGRLIETERRFTADAAHELRTPIAGIRAQAQVARGALSDEERRHALDQLLRGCDRAAHLIDQLLMLARVDAGATEAAGPQALAALVRLAVAEQLPGVLARGQSIDVEADEECQVSGSPVWVGVLLRNLLDNASRYGGTGARLRVSVAWHGEQPQVTVEDSGPGLPEADLQRLGERFYRAETGLASGQPGSGLGWSIVRRIALVLGLQVLSDRSAELGGLRVRVRWPVSPRAPAR